MPQQQSQHLDDPSRRTVQEQRLDQQQPVDIFLTHVPANLRAKFGRTRCRELLADQAEVQRVWSRLTAGDEATAGCHGYQLEQRRRPPPRLPPLSQQRQPTDWYAVLSEQFNSDYSPGVAATRRLGHNHETHNESAFDQSADFNNTTDGRHKRRKDEFNAYNEIIHVERKFSNQWARDSTRQTVSRTADAGAARRQPPPAAAAVMTQPSSILSGRGGGSGSGPPGKRVTISEQGAGGGGGAKGDAGQQSLHRANTVQRED